MSTRTHAHTHKHKGTMRQTPSMASSFQHAFHSNDDNVRAAWPCTLLSPQHTWGAGQCVINAQREQSPPQRKDANAHPNTPMTTPHKRGKKQKKGHAFLHSHNPPPPQYRHKACNLPLSSRARLSAPAATPLDMLLSTPLPALSSHSNTHRSNHVQQEHRGTHTHTHTHRERRLHVQ